jgi:hypothetical protein
MKRPVITGMRLLIVMGVSIAALGTFIVFKGPRVHSEGTVNVGPFHSTVHEQHTIPPLFGWVAIVGGVLLGIAGTQRKR